MISFKKFLQGNADTSKVIQEKCQPFLEQSKGVPLYRGYGGVVANLTKQAHQIINVRKDRRPRDSDIYAHDLLNAYFVEKFGVKVRSEGLFVIGDIETAQEYGNVNYVFPVGEFKFVWGTVGGKPLKDSIKLARRVMMKVEVSPKAEAHNLTKEIMDEIDWHSDNLIRGIKMQSEIALLCDQVILVPYREGFSYSSVING